MSDPAAAAAAQQPETPLSAEDFGRRFYSQMPAAVRQRHSSQELAQAAAGAWQQYQAMLPKPQEPSLGERALGAAKTVGHVVAQTAGDIANYVKFGLAHPQGEFEAALTPDVAAQNQQQVHADFQALGQEGQASLGRGMAFVQSAVAAPALGTILPMTSIGGRVITGRAAQLLVGDMIGNTAYMKAAEPEAPLGQAVQQGAQATLLGAGIAGIGAGFSKLARLATPHAAAPVVTTDAAQSVANAARSLSDAELAAHPLGRTPPLEQSAVVGTPEHASAAAQKMLATVNEGVNAAVAMTPTKQLAAPELARESERLLIERSQPLTFEQAIGKGLAGSDEAAAQALVDHGHVRTPNSGLLTEASEAPKPLIEQPNVKEVLANLKDDQLEALHKLMQSQMGGVPRRLLTGTVGAGLVATGNEAQDMSEGTRSLVRGLGYLMLGESLLGLPPIRGFTKSILGSLDAKSQLVTPGTREVADHIEKMLNIGKADVNQKIARLEQIFTTPESREAISYAVERGEESPHWGTLTGAQQSAIPAIQATNRGMGQIIESAQMGHGLNDALLEYMPRVLKPTAKAALDQKFGGLQNAVNALRTNPGFLKQRTFRFREDLQGWLTQNGLPDALERDGLESLRSHWEAVHKAIANRTMIDDLTSMGFIKDLERAPGNLPAAKFMNPPEGWRLLSGSVFNSFHELNGKIAPNDVATLLENMAKKGLSGNALTKGYDRLNGAALQAIMYNSIFHSFNLLRRGGSAGVGPHGYAIAAEALRSGDPVVTEWAGHGLLQGSSERYIQDIGGAFDALLARTKQGSLTQQALSAISDFSETQHNVLFGATGRVNALGLAVATKEQAAWLKRTNFKFGAGTPEYDSAMRRIASYANNQAGRIPQTFRSADFQRWFGRIAFAPQWLESWGRLWAGAWGDAGSVLHGAMKPGDALYAKAKMRIVLGGVAMTGAVSLALGGKLPEWDADKARLLAYTGLTDKNGRPIMVDILGGLGDDPRALVHPGQFVANKVAPGVRLVGAAAGTLTGTSAPEGAENVFQQLGGLPQAAEALARPLATGQAPTAGEVLRDVGGSTGLFRLSALRNATVTAAARKMLLQARVPVTNERLYELTRAMYSDYTLSKGQNWAGRAVSAYLGHEARTVSAQHPFTRLGEKLKDLLPSWNQ